MTSRRTIGVGLSTAVLAAAVSTAASTAGYAKGVRHAKLPQTLAGHTFDFHVNNFIQPPGTLVHGLSFALQYSADGQHVTYTKLSGNGSGPSCETEKVHVTALGNHAYFIRWIEADGLIVSRVDNLRTGAVREWIVIPTSLTGAPKPLTISPTGTLSRYTGKAIAQCAAQGSGI